MIDETDVAQRISRLVRACKRTAEMMVRGTPVTDEIADHLDAVRDAACEVTGAEPRRYAELSTDTSAEWMQAELDMQTHCDGIQAHAAAAVLALAREPHDDTQEAALNYCEAQQLSARHLLQWHAAELHRMVVGLHRLLNADEPPTLAQIRAVRTGQQVFDHRLPPAEPRMDSLPDLRLPPAAPMTEGDVRAAAPPAPPGAPAAPMPSAGAGAARLTDSTGLVRIKVGQAVRQASPQGTPWYDERAGALLCNAGQTGTVVAVARTRVRVDFGRTRRDAYGSVESTQPLVDVVHASMLTVVTGGG